MNKLISNLVIAINSNWFDKQNKYIEKINDSVLSPIFPLSFFSLENKNNFTQKQKNNKKCKINTKYKGNWIIKPNKQQK